MICPKNTWIVFVCPNRLQFSNNVLCMHTFITETKDQPTENEMENKAMWKGPSSDILITMLHPFNLVNFPTVFGNDAKCVLKTTILWSQDRTRNLITSVCKWTTKRLKTQSCSCLGTCMAVLLRMAGARTKNLWIQTLLLLAVNCSELHTSSL